MWRITLALVAPVVLAVAIALSPFWLAAHEGMEPAGPACWFEYDPGSGSSGVGVERHHWGVAPYVSCLPVGPVEMATSGPDFDAAVTRMERAGPYVDPMFGAPTEWALDSNRSFAIYGVLWPVAAGALSFVLSLVVGASIVVVLAHRRAAARARDDLPRVTAGAQ